METYMVQESSKDKRATTCVHQRLIDTVLTRRKKPTGKVQCLECGVVFDDPHHAVS